MTRAQAIQKIRRLLGVGAWWQVHPNAYDKDSRVEVAARERTLRTSLDILNKALDDRRKQLLADDGPYQTMISDRKEVETALKNLGNRAPYRFVIGTVTEYGFGRIEGQGDTWEEALAAVEKRKAER